MEDRLCYMSSAVYIPGPVAAPLGVEGYFDWVSGMPQAQSHFVDVYFLKRRWGNTGDLQHNRMVAGSLAGY